MTNETDKGKIGIGTKETVALKPAQVKLLGYKIEMQKKKEGNKEIDIGEKVSVICKHPEKEENIEISAVSYKKGKEIKTSGLWWKLDEDGCIIKQSALAFMLVFMKANCLDDLAGKDAMTELDEKGYLCFKAY